VSGWGGGEGGGGGRELEVFDFQSQYFMETAVGQWLRCCATSRKVAGSIPAGVIGSFH